MAEKKTIRPGRSSVLREAYIDPESLDGKAAAWLEGIERLIQMDEYFFCVNRFLFCAVK